MFVNSQGGPQSTLIAVGRAGGGPVSDPLCTRNRPSNGHEASAHTVALPVSRIVDRPPTPARPTAPRAMISS